MADPRPDNLHLLCFILATHVRGQATIRILSTILMVFLVASCFSVAFRATVSTSASFRSARRVMTSKSPDFLAPLGGGDNTSQSPFENGTIALRAFHDDHCLVVHYLNSCVKSTQDEAKWLLQNPTFGETCDVSQSQHFAVIAHSQTRGRGTSGRAWVSSPGNLYITYCLPMNDIIVQKLTLLPLSIGVLVAEAIQPFLEDTSSNVTVKWPNDVLLSGHKVAGTLIENCAGPSGSNDYWLIVGIGVNLASHPQDLPLEDESKTPTRLATSLKLHIAPSTTAPSAVEFGLELSRKLWHLVRQGELGNWRSSGSDITGVRSIVERWRSLANMGEY
jgi:biotin-[acetyl-CoA-carboxylase] ligase BirA-like protein